MDTNKVREKLEFEIAQLLAKYGCLDSEIAVKTIDTDAGSGLYDKIGGHFLVSIAGIITFDVYKQIHPE